MPALRSPNDLLAKELKEIFSAERQLSRVLPRLAKTVATDAVREALERRREQGAQLMEEIDQALEEMGTTKARPKNPAIEGLLEDINQDREEIEDERVREAALIGGIQKVQHYCIAAWGTSASLGRLLGEEKAVEAMERVLEEGKRFDEELTEIAERDVNPRMLEDEEGEEGGEEEGSEEENGGEQRGRKGGGGQSKGRKKA
jgi:ferritin-like metal-binding protein YciE